MRHLITSLALGLAAALALPPASATAGSVRVEDPDGDVRTWSTDAAGDATTTAAPGAQPDITSFTLVHRPRSIVLRLTTTGVDQVTDREGFAAQFRLRGSNGQLRVLGVFAGREGSDGRDNELTRVRNGALVCRGAVTSRLDRATGTVTATVPRRCLDAPRRVRAGATAYVTSSFESGPTRVDSALQVGGTAATLGKPYRGTGSTRWVGRG